MEKRTGPGPIAVFVIALMVLLVGCLKEDEGGPGPNPRVNLEGPEEAWVGDLVQFDATDTSDDDTEFEALNFSWEMGDGALYWGKPFVSMSIARVNHTYERSGTYQVNLTVIDVGGDSTTVTHEIVVTYQLNLTINKHGTWIGEGSLNNTTYYNLTVTNAWTDLFDLPLVQVMLLNYTRGQLRPISTQGDPVPANLTPGGSFTQQVHFRVPETFVPVILYVTEELVWEIK